MKLLYDVREIRICLTDECKVIHVIINCYLGPSVSLSTIVFSTTGTVCTKGKVGRDPFNRHSSNVKN